MKPEDIKTGTIYTDAMTAVRTVRQITSITEGGREIRVVICHEHAGLNRNRVHTMPLDSFAAFARHEIEEHDIADVDALLGLDAYPLDARTKDMIAMAIDRRISPRETGDRLRLEKLVGHGLATRDGPRGEAESYILSEKILAAANRSSSRKTA